MAANYLDSLISSLGGESEGPDPSRLEGLVQLLRDEASDLEEPLQRMRSRIQEAGRDRQAAFEDRRSQLSPEVASLIERNLGACQVLDGSLEQIAQENTPEGREVFERAVSEFLETCDLLANLGSSSVPLCPRCGSSGPEPLCPSCQLDRLIPDVSVTEEDYSRAMVGEEFLAVYEAYVQVIEGKAALEPLLQALQSLEFSLLEAQALAEQAAEDSPPHQRLLEVINGAVEGVNRLHAVQENRSTRELHQGWQQIFAAAAVVPQLLPQETEDEE
ncbi:hypothetical protein ABS71_08375 [bacterium SCN 62-11]|nr:hypothetical protein [Candidatus Eremiobacteraeota bacterium]ODT70837.1 MAG: hypothetical protein ABS71_08375 [bacterium SCN 62-11]